MSDLGRHDDEYGSVDLFGLDEFGQPVGLGAPVGAGLGILFQTGTAIAVRRFTDMDKWSEGIGAVVGAVAGGAMMAMADARHAGMTAIIASVVSGGLRQAEQLMSAKEAVKQEAVKKNGDKTAGWGLPTIEPSWSAFPGELTPQNSLGYPVVQDQFIVPGSMGPGTTSQFEGNLGMPPQLVGAGDYGLSQNPAAQQAALVGPGVSGLGSHYGSTIFG